MLIKKLNIYVNNFNIKTKIIYKMFKGHKINIETLINNT